MYKKQKTALQWNKARADKMKEYRCWECPLCSEHCSPFKPCRNPKMKKTENFEEW